MDDLPEAHDVLWETLSHAQQDSIRHHAATWFSAFGEAWVHDNLFTYDYDPTPACTDRRWTWRERHIPKH